MLNERSARALVVGSASAGLRRALGPTSWMVLEELMLRSTVVGERRVARASVRSLARSLGVAKDTAARAVRRLRIAGVVIGAQQRTASGVFDTGVYVIIVPSEVLTVKTTTTAKPRHSAFGSGESQLPLALEA